MPGYNQLTYLTKEGYEKLKEELRTLKTVKRKEVAWRIQQAKELGDLSENAEYTEAKNEQAFLEGRIAELENVIKNAEIISSVKRPAGGMVEVGAHIQVKTEDGKETEFTIVGSQEADPKSGIISNESPLGRAFLGHMVGDKVEVQVPKGIATYQIVKVF
ncbi:transcription elongation factor GreA [Candidatus Uhrbacteria bacterium RIFCSPLOWO2_02_FULL_49_11]|uniref:Transcription elongation factor GreA n=1 Tax=Candidatus Uhrbacteria bacterium RIFCSPLOWO2_02_FULL_49_11 TaxID=1802409 RepID=A0A1F7VCR1_9BACT|nr:MAG: transcription elongation factor GreA [Candidatus Uhrbacteria bacterium RIFCSPLOWO2_02_FULL_49_11]